MFLNYTNTGLAVQNHRAASAALTDCIYDFAQDMHAERAVTISINDVDTLLDALCDGETMERMGIADEQETIEYIYEVLLVYKKLGGAA